jgi:hypothetical protein
MIFPKLNRATGLFWWKFPLPHKPTKNDFSLGQHHISLALSSGEPRMMGKLGTTELMGLEFFDRWLKPSFPANASWRRPAERLLQTAGLFPVSREIFFRWKEVYLESVHHLDIVAHWQPPGTFLSVYEHTALTRFAPLAQRVPLASLQPILPPASWLPDILGKRWMVVSPFRETIRSQLPRLSKLGIYPNTYLDRLENTARNLQVVASPQLAYMVPPRHRDWFHALDCLQQEISACSFDIALIGAGAWSLPLAAYVKKMGKTAMHLGGQLQLMFGIRGGRWDHKANDLYNEFWIRPLPEETPKNHQLMEHGAYW